MDLKQAIEITEKNPELNIFMPVRYGVGITIRKAKQPNTSIPNHILERNEWLSSEGYEVAAFDVSDMTKANSKGVYIPETQEKWIPWGLEDQDLKRQSFMII